MTYIERMCLASMVAAGHPVFLYSYDDIQDLPDGVTLKDAAAIVPRDRIIRHEKTGSYALFSDIFRYEGLKRGLGIWCDADVLLLRDLSGLGDRIMGWETGRSVNNAVLYLPPDEPFLGDMLRIAQSRIPFAPQWKWRRRVKQVLERKPLSKLEWGVIGPRAITHYVKANNVKVESQEVFYPVPFAKWRTLFIPNYPVERMLTEKTRAIHLWNNVLKDFREFPPPAGSFIARMCDRFSVLSNSVSDPEIAYSAV